MTDYHVRISAPNNPEQFAVLIDSLEVGDDLVWNGRSEPFTVTDIEREESGLDGIGQFKKWLIVENQTRENGAEFRLRFEEGSDHSLSPGSSGWGARCVVQRQIGDRALNDGGWGRCDDVESLAHVNPVESAERDGEHELVTDGGTADLEGLSTHDLVGKALAEHDDQDATDGIPTGDVVDWVVSRTELVRADVHDAIEWLHDRGHVYEPRPDFLRRTEADSERWLAVAWHEALVEAHAETGDLDPRYLVDRYGAETPDEVDELVGQGVKEVIRGDNDRLTLDDLDAAEEKLKESGYEVATDGGERR